MRLFISLVLLTIALCGTASAADEFLISYWWAPYELNQERVQEIADCGFNVAWFQQQENQKQILDYCQAAGIKAMIGDKRFLAKNVGDPEFESNLDSVIADYSKHPAFWGYHITDEPGAGLFGLLGAINQYLLKKDPKHVPFINLFPTYARDFPGALGTATYDEYIAQYMETVKPKILSYDHYALMNGGERADYFENLETIRKYALKYDVPFNYIFLAIQHFDYRDPSEIDLRWQVNTALAYGAKGLMYFTYRSVAKEWGSALLDMNDQKTEKYYIAKQINSELKNMGPTLMRLTSTGVYHTRPYPKDTNALPAGKIVKSVDGGEFVIGLFETKRGEQYAMFVNRSFKNEADARILFSKKANIYEVDRATGWEKALILPDWGDETLWKARFKPGEGRLVRIEPVGN